MDYRPVKMKSMVTKAIEYFNIKNKVKLSKTKSFQTKQVTIVDAFKKYGMQTSEMDKSPWEIP